jgi:hypothetical protein
LAGFLWEPLALSPAFLWKAGVMKEVIDIFILDIEENNTTKYRDGERDVDIKFGEASGVGKSRAQVVF